MKRVSPREAKELLDQGWTYVDVRSESEFEQGHPAGAVNVPLMHAGPGGMTPNPDFLQVMQAAFPKDSRLVLGCLSGNRSTRATQLLESDGYLHLANQYCGWAGARDPSGQVEPGWVSLGLPVEQGQPEGRAYRDLARKA